MLGTDNYKSIANQKQIIIEKLFNFMAFPLINLLISLLDFSIFDKIIKSKTVIFSLIFFALIFIVGKLEPSKFPEKASLAACSEFLAAFFINTSFKFFFNFEYFS